MSQPNTDGLSYIREPVIYEEGYRELVRITWPPNSQSCAHDHGESFGFIIVKSGTIWQEVFDRKTRKFLRREEFSTGQTFQETPDIIHIMGSYGGGETEHDYYPPPEMTQYSESELIR